MHERVRLQVAVADRPVELQRVLVTRQRAVVFVQVVVGVAEAVPRRGLAVAVTDLLVDGQSPAALLQRLRVPARQDVGPADFVGHAGLPAAPSGLPVEETRLGVVLQGLLMATARVGEKGRIAVHPALSGPVPDIGEQVQGARQMPGRIHPTLQPTVGEAQRPVGVGLSAYVPSPCAALAAVVWATNCS